MNLRWVEGKEYNMKYVEFTGKTVEEALTLASRAAGIAVTRPGAAASIPQKNEI